MSKWTDILTWDQLKANHFEVDPTFGKKQLCFWTSCTIKQLRVLQAQAWLTNDDEQWQKARSYLVLSGEKL